MPAPSRPFLGHVPPATSKAAIAGVPIGEPFDPSRWLPTPALTLDLDRVVGNIHAMAEWAAVQGAGLAPHGKTTMSPALWRAQLDAGAIGITVANAAQARVAVEARIPLVIIANQVISPPALTWIAETLSTTETRMVCWVDSVAGVAAMQEALTAAGASRPLSVCVEAGWPASRTGSRSLQEAHDVADAVVRASALKLVGVSGYEGTVPGASPQDTGPVDRFLEWMAEVFSSLQTRFEAEDPILTAGGSSYFDRVVTLLRPVTETCPGARLVVRPGAYVLHDDDLYGLLTPAASRRGPRFTPAATLWGRVLSVPEPGLALVDFGKRDAAHDLGLPTPRAVWREGQPPAPIDAQVTGCHDQHAFLDLGSSQLVVGDLLEFGQSHPCTIADKWRDVAVITRVDGGGLRLEGYLEAKF